MPVLFSSRDVHDDFGGILVSTSQEFGIVFLVNLDIICVRTYKRRKKKIHGHTSRESYTYNYLARDCVGFVIFCTEVNDHAYSLYFLFKLIVKIKRILTQT